MTPHLWVVVPFSRPEMLPNVVQNWERQEYPHKSLVIVENGRGVGACAEMGFMPDAVVQSEAHQSHAKNAGMQYARGQGAEWFATMDDDDYYGGQYLTKIAGALADGWDIVGHSMHYTQMSDGRMYLFEHQGEEQLVSLVAGATIAAPLRHDTPEFPVLDWAEDNAWIDAQREAGASVYAVGRSDFCAVRHSHVKGHTHPVTDEALLNMGCALHSVYDCGLFTADVVDGLVEPYRFDRLPAQELDHTLHPAWGRLHSKEESNGINLLNQVPEGVRKGLGI